MHKFVLTVGQIYLQLSEEPQNNEYFMDSVCDVLLRWKCIMYQQTHEPHKKEEEKKKKEENFCFFYCF